MSLLLIESFSTRRELEALSYTYYSVMQAMQVRREYAKEAIDAVGDEHRSLHVRSSYPVHIHPQAMSVDGGP